jgi:REP element-mobilizing transposase RayT
VYRSIHADCERLGVEVITLGGIEDHIHLLVRLPKRLTVPDLAHQLKGSSSHLLRQSALNEGFGWQEGYSAFSVSRWDVQRLTRYIEAQAEHHSNGDTKSTLEPAS